MVIKSALSGAMPWADLEKLLVCRAHNYLAWSDPTQNFFLAILDKFTFTTIFLS